MLGQVRHLFGHQHAYQAGNLDRACLLTAMLRVQSVIRRLPEQDSEQPLPQAVALSQESRELLPSLWTFVRVVGMEQNDNRAG